MKKNFYSFIIKFCYSGTRRVFASEYQKEVIQEDEKSRNGVTAALSVDRLYCKTCAGERGKAADDEILLLSHL